MFELNKIYHADCMYIMKDIPDKYFELAIVDPPYGIGEDGENLSRSFNSDGKARINPKWKNPKPKNYIRKNWDKEPAPLEYYNELFRVSKNQIIWGANHFISRMPYDSSGWIFWDKKNGNSDFSDGELAWTSFKKGLRKFAWLWNGFQKEKPETRIHPTQKPVALYRWLLQNYAKPGDKIIDTHSGSGSCAIACHLEKFDFLAIEKDEDYFKASVERLKTLRSQLTLF
jgi:site-specific DNA-methyltransferase (adenine-specific)